MLDAFGIETAVVVGHDWGGPVAWHCALLRPDRFAAVAALSVHFGGVAPVPTPRVATTDAMRAALGDTFLYVLYFQEPGVAERELDADLRRTLGAILYGLSGDCPATSTASSTRRPRSSSTSCATCRVRSPWLSDADLDVFVESFSHHGTFAGGINWYRNIDRNQELLAAFAGKRIDQPALFIGAEHDSIFGQTPEAVLHDTAAVPALREPVWVAGSGHWIQQERPAEVNAALLDFLRSLPDWGAPAS